MSSTTTYVVPPGQEAAVQRMVNPPSGLPPGWSFLGAKLSRSDLRALYRDARGQTVRLTMHHRDHAATGLRTDRFLLVLEASARDDGVSALQATLASSVRAGESEFHWLAISPEPAAPTPIEAAQKEDAVAISPRPEDAARSVAATLEATADDVARFGPAEEREIDLHLELEPFFDLDLRFDFAACLDEARALTHRFVAHQSDASYGIEGWRSLALRAFDGDCRRSAMPEGEDAADDSRYRETEIAALCPKTMAFLDGILDVSRTRSISFLLLEPRHRIAVHVDTDLSDEDSPAVMRSLNIALNMPAGCDFYIETHPDGTASPFTRRAPFSDGTGLLMNVARYHYVVNDSDVPRFHLNARGSLKIPTARLLELARRHTQKPTLDAVVEALIEKHRTLGVAIKRSSGLNAHLPDGAPGSR